MRKKLKKCRIILLISIWMISACQLFGQEVQITGKVTDAATKEAIPGVNVIIKGTTKGIPTDAEGNYKISVTPGSTLVFSFIGYKSLEVIVGNTLSYNVALENEAAKLEEVVIIGYGQVKKSDATGSVVAVDSKDFNKGAITSAQDLLMGKTAGVVINDASGGPGAGVTIRVRGGSSLNASNDPLIIVDGVPIDNTAASGQSNILDILNPNDIETFTVLKDASATAIYGSRASNGVIIITTKKGKVGSEMKISYEGKGSVQVISKYLDVFSGDQLRSIANSLTNINGIQSLNVLGSQNTNWQKQIYQVSFSNDHNLSLTGAYKTLPYRFSLGYTDNEGILKGTSFERGTGSIALNPTFLDNSLKVNVNAKGEYTDYNYGDYGAVGGALRMDPTEPVYQQGAAAYAGYWQWQNPANGGADLGTPNPVAQALLVNNYTFVMRGLGNVQLDYANPLIPELHANLNLGVDYVNTAGLRTEPPTQNTQISGTPNGVQSSSNGYNSNSLLDFYLNYVKEINAIKSKIDLTAGYSWQHFLEQNNSEAHSVPIPGVANTVLPPSEAKTENYLLSFFGRLNYTLLDRYLITATIRDDGSSRFSSANRWGLFPALALAWKINQESFLKDVKAVSDLKLRLGYGVTGQQNIVGNDYPAQALYVSAYPGSYYEMAPGYFVPTQRPQAFNPGIKWESTTTYNVGLDLGFFNNRISATFDLYRRNTTDLLQDVPIPLGSNYSNYAWGNLGSMYNQGYEVTLNLVPVSTKDMNLTIGFNLTYNENKITALYESGTIPVAEADLSSGFLQLDKVGSPANSFFMNKQVYNSQGQPIEGAYVDLSGKGGAVYQNSADMYLDHSPAPDYTMGISARFNYKGFDISASGRVELGNYVYNYPAASTSYNILYTLGYWQNSPTYLAETNFVNRQYASDYFVQNASFFKLDNASIGYNFNKIVDKLTLRISFTAQNLIVATSYKGQDPEVGVNGNPAYFGVDQNNYPRARTYLFGLSLTY